METGKPVGKMARPGRLAVPAGQRGWRGIKGGSGRVSGGLFCFLRIPLPANLRPRKREDARAGIADERDFSRSPRPAKRATRVTYMSDELDDGNAQIAANPGGDANGHNRPKCPL